MFKEVLILNYHHSQEELNLRVFKDNFKETRHMLESWRSMMGGRLEETGTTGVLLVAR